MTEVSDELEQIQREVAAELAELDRITDELIAQFGKLSARVAAGQLPEMAVLQKAMEMQAKMMGA